MGAAYLHPFKMSPLYQSGGSLTYIPFLSLRGQVPILGNMVTDNRQVISWKIPAGRLNDLDVLWAPAPQFAKITAS